MHSIEEPDYPAEYEFIEFFEVEPTTLDEDVVWFYNRNTYSTRRDSYQVDFMIEPASREFRLEVRNFGVTVIDLSGVKILGISFDLRRDSERMILKFRDESELLPLVLVLKPNVSVSWGMFQL